MVIPDLPDPAHVDVDSMLSRRFGKEITNYFSGSPSFNRVSFLRTNHQFISSALKHPSSTFLLFNKLAPLGTGPTRLQYLAYNDVQPLIEDRFSTTEEEEISSYDSSLTIPELIFLGLDESSSSNTGFEWDDTYRGTPFFALDVTPKGTIAVKTQRLVDDLTSRGFEFLQGRLILTLPASQANLYATARALISWHDRSPFCSSCGYPTLSVHAGWKRICPPKDTSNNASQSNRPNCATRQGVHNSSFPRTDPTAIMATFSANSKYLLLGRQKRWPANWYSALAGFIEPGESVEEAVRREVWEESGVTVGRVIIHSTQPWPPASLMIGAIAQAVPGKENISLEHDPELEAARWYPIKEVKDALQSSVSNLGEDPPAGYKDGALRLPPKTAIANQLLAAAIRLVENDSVESRI